MNEDGRQHAGVEDWLRFGYSYGGTQMQPSRAAQKKRSRLLIRWLAGMVWIGMNAVAAELPSQTIHSLGALQNVAATNYQAIASLSVTGLVCSADAEARLVALQDDSTVVLLRLPHLASSVHPGDWLAISATNVTLARDEAGVLVGVAPVAEIDARHPPLSRSGRVFLTAGWQPVRLEWFNGQAGGYLDVGYEGPNLAQQRIPDSALRCRTTGQAAGDGFRPGLNFTAYQGTEWNVLPNLSTLTPFVSGNIANFDASQYSQQSPVAMLFSGFLKIQTPGVYTFQVTSDDGARLFVGNPATRCISRKLERSSPLPTAMTLAQAMARRDRAQWVSLEGTVTFASHRGNHVELEVVHRGVTVSTLIANSAALALTNLPGLRVKVTGICRWPHEARTPRLIVPGADQVQLTNGSQANLDTETQITMAALVRGLQPAEARRRLPAVIRGVVTTANPRSCVVQDSSGPVFVRPSNGVWPNQPLVGESWEFAGVTDPGEFSPIVLATNSLCLGNGTLPPPIRPSWEQLLNGSLDVELVEVLGIVLETTPDEMMLLTHGGQVNVVGHWEYPLPYPTALIQTNQTLVGARVRVRGVFFALRDSAAQLIPGRFLLGDPMISVDQPAPGDPFDVPTRHVTDLLRFTSHADELTRFKVAGQILYVRSRECFLLDGDNGFRVITKEPVELVEGDLVEAVGFPQLGGPSPVLVAARVRKSGKASLPKPREIQEAELLDENHDSTLVSVEARLLSDVVRLGERVLELQADGHRFLARLRLTDQPTKPLRPGSRVRLTGVYVSTRGDSADSSSGFELLLNRPTDIAVLKPGPWWTKRHTIASIAVLLIGLAAALVWIALLRRTVAHRTVLLESEIHQREQSEQRRLLEQERARVAHDLHDELGAGLAEISLIGSLAQRPATQTERARGLLAQLTDKSRQMVTSLDEIVWAINPKHDTSSSVRGYLSDYAQEFLRPSPIVCRLDVASNQPEQAMNMTQRHQLFLAFKEALTNVLKHSEATEVCIRAASSVHALRVAVEDNGRGMPPQAEQANGNGISSMRERLDNIGGRCEIKARPGGGTIVSFHLPVNG